MAAWEGLKSKYSVIPPVCSCINTIQSVLLYYLLNIFLVNYSGLTNILDWNTYFEEFYINSTLHSTVAVQCNCKQGSDWKEKHTTECQFSCMFCTWKITYCCVQFQFEAFCMWLCVNRGFSVLLPDWHSSSNSEMLPRTQSICGASAIGDACIC